NIHGIYTEATRIVSPTSVEIKMGHFQQRGFNFAATGDTLSVVDKSSFKTTHSLVVKSIDKVNNKYYRLNFYTDISKIIGEGTLFDNMSWYPEVLIRNNKAINNRARAFLIATPKKVIIENNTFSNMMSAILMDEFNWWYEAGHPSDVTIRNNTFLDCTYGGGNNAIIHINTSAKGLVQNIFIVNNKFNSFDPFVLHAEGVSNLHFSDNEITQSNNYPVLNGKNPVLSLPGSSGLRIINNKYKGDAKLFIRPEQVNDKMDVVQNNLLNGKKIPKAGSSK
ncbi:MAG: hypothetical protein WKF91_11170, partial [Segetibacter sp.]